MGILNITPDSFSDGGLYFENVQAAASRARKMLKEGADIIDIGGESTRPGSQPISLEEELRRVIPIIVDVRKLGNDFFISVDTRKSEVAKVALEKGADMVNSLGGAQFDPEILDVVSKYQCPWIIYHIRGTPQTMQQGAIEYKNTVKDIYAFLNQQIVQGLKKGIKREQILVDPGIGFGKTVEQNLEIICRLTELEKLKLPIVISVSRKSHLGKILQEELGLSEIPSPQERLEAGLAETAVALINGAHIIRTHDVAATKKFVATLDRVWK